MKKKMLRTLSLTLVVIMMVCATLLPASYALDSTTSSTKVTFKTADAKKVDFWGGTDESSSGLNTLGAYIFGNGKTITSGKKWGGVEPNGDGTGAVVLKSQITVDESGASATLETSTVNPLLKFKVGFDNVNSGEYGVFVNGKYVEPDAEGVYTVLLQNGMTISANKKYTVTLPTSTEDYYISKTTTVVESGEKFEFTVTPKFDSATGKVFKVTDIAASGKNKFKVGEVDISSDGYKEQQTFTVSSVDSDHTILISAAVPPTPTYSISAEYPTDDMHFTTDFQPREGLKTGSTYSFTVTPAKGYNPPSVTVDHGKISNDGNGNYTVVVADSNVKVTFKNGEKITTKVTLSSSVDGATVTVDGKYASNALQGVDVDYGENVPVTVAVNNGYRVDSVTYTADGITRVLEGVNGNYTIPNVTGEVTITVAVSKVQVTVVYKLPNATIGTFSIPSSGINKEVVCTVSNGIENGKITLETPKEQTGFTFNGWTSSDANIDESNQISVSGTQDRTITVTGTWSFDVMSLFKTKSYSSTMTNSGNVGSYTNSVDYTFELNENAKSTYASQMIVRAGGIVYCADNDQDLSVVKGYVGTGTYSDRQVFSEQLKVRGYIGTSSSAIGEDGVNVSYRIGSPSTKAFAHPWIKVELGGQSFVIFAEDLVR